MSQIPSAKTPQRSLSDWIDHATEYYNLCLDLLRAFAVDFGVIDVWSVNEKLSNEDNVALCKSFSEEEIKNVIEGIKKNKVVGCDGFPLEFYQACRIFIKEHIMMHFHMNFGCWIDLNTIKSRIITLIPMGVDAHTTQKN